jgi:hypothetical protein
MILSLERLFHNCDDSIVALLINTKWSKSNHNSQFSNCYKTPTHPRDLLFQITELHVEQIMQCHLAGTGGTYHTCRAPESKYKVKTALYWKK